MFNKTVKSGGDAPVAEPPARSSLSAPRSNAVPSIISADLVIEGNLKSSGEIQIDGRVIGDIESRSVTVGQTAEVQGQVSCESARINGSLSGEIRAKSVIISKTAQIRGDVVHETVAIETGAHVEGHLRRIERETTERLPPPAAEAFEEEDRLDAETGPLPT